HVLPDPPPRVAHVLRTAPARLSARRGLHRLVGRVGQPARPADRALSGPLSPEAGVYYTSVIWVRQLPSALRSNSRPGSPPPRSAPVCLRVASFVISWRRPRPPGAGGPSCDWRDRSAARAISRHGRAFRTREGHRRHGLSRGIREP